MSRRRWARWLGVGLGGLGALVLVLYVASAEVRYVLRAGVEEARILLAREPLERLIADPAVAPSRRAAFQLVLDARAFAAGSLGLDAGGTYTTYADVGRDTLVLVLSASPSDRLVPYTWWYPIVGSVPYKGFFRAEHALAAARRLEAQGLDTYLRPSGAFSTLGWFNDPLLSTAMSEDPVQLAATVIHEIAHNTLYLRGQTRFNESFASFVGYRGAEAFFLSRRDSVAAQRAAGMWHDEIVLGRVLSAVMAQLRAVYGSDGPAHVVAATRDSAFTALQARFRGPIAAELRVYAGERLAAREFNNATLIAWTLYRWRLETFERVLAGAEGDVREAVATIVARLASRPDEVDPYEVLARALNARAAAPPPPRGPARSCTPPCATARHVQ